MWETGNFDLNRDGVVDHRMPILAVCVCLWALAPVADATTFEAAKNQLNERGLRIKVAPGRWGQANTEDIEAVLYSVADSFVRYFPDRQLPRILVEPVSGNPRVLFERGLGGEYVIHLSARDRRWSQYAYQFAHELCHILSNFDNEEAKDGAGALQNLWFEESVCDAAAPLHLEANDPRGGMRRPIRIGRRMRPRSANTRSTS